MADSARRVRTLGFTLIELLVVITLIMVLAGGALAGYRRFNDRQVIVTSGKELMVNLRQAQGKATSGVKVVDGTCLATSTLAGYRVRAVAGAATYTIEQACRAGAVLSYTLPRTYSLSQGATFTNGFDFLFQGQYGGATVNPSPLSIRIQPPSGSAMTQSYVVTVDQSGLVSDGGLQ